MTKMSTTPAKRAIALSKKRTGTRAMIEALATGSLDLKPMSINQLLVLHDAYRAAGKAFMHAANEPRAMSVEIIDAWWGALEGLADHIAFEAEQRIPKTKHEAEDRGKLVIAHHALTGERFSKIAAMAAEVAVEMEKLK